MSAPAALPAAWTAGGLIKPSAFDAHNPKPNPADPMKAVPTGATQYDDDGTILCGRGRHRMTGENKYKGTMRCNECKNEDGRKYDLKRYGPAATPRTAPPAAVPAATPTITAATPNVAAVQVAPKPKPSGIMGYRSRDLAGKADTIALQELAAGGVFVNLYGPPGTGKTQLVRAAFPDCLIINGDQDTTVGDFTGTWSPTGNRDNPYIWNYGPLTTAMLEGRKLFVDDCTLIPTNVISVLYPVMDGQGFVQVKDHAVDGAPEMVKAADGFYIIGGFNPNAHGSYYAPALRSRFALHILVETDYEVGSAMGMDRRLIKLCRNLSVSWHNGDMRSCPQMREMIAYHNVQKILGDTAALQNLTSTIAAEDMETFAKAVNSCYGIPTAEVKILALGRML